MAIYTEDVDFNEMEETTKDVLIQEINKIISEYGSFSVWDIEADHSPSLDVKGRFSHLAEEFREGDCTIRVYDPSSHSSDEIDEYDEFYEEFEESQLEYILELAREWDGDYFDTIEEFIGKELK